MKIAILIDGGFFLKRLPTVRPDIDHSNPAEVDRAIGHLVWNHLKFFCKKIGGANPNALLYRCFYYDAYPFRGGGHFPISKRAIDYAKSSEALFRLELFDNLRKRPNFAVRLGQVIRERSWILKEQAQKDVLSGKRDIADLADADFFPGFRQKAVDMRLGLDIASITLKKQADAIILTTGDSDFVPAAKLARREGVRIVLDPLWQSVSSDLFEHIDELRSGFFKPGSRASASNNESPQP